jgi:hypothetical protein
MSSSSLMLSSGQPETSEGSGRVLHIGQAPLRFDKLPYAADEQELQQVERHYTPHVMTA